MKRILLSLIVLFSLVILTGCKSKTVVDYGNIENFSFSYGSYNNGNYSYSITVDGDDVYYRAIGSNGVDLNVIRKIDSSYIDRIKKIIVDYDVLAWDGFSDRDDSVVDGNSFNLTIEYTDVVINASGYMKYPKNYDKVKKALSKLFDEINALEPSNDLMFSLHNNSSIGYSWKYDLSEEGIVSVSSYYDKNGCGMSVGCDEYRVFILKGLVPGNVTLSMTYSFIEPEKYDQETAVYEITVNDDLTISETHSGSYFGSFYDKQ